MLVIDVNDLRLILIPLSRSRLNGTNMHNVLARMPSLLDTKDQYKSTLRRPLQLPHLLMGRALCGPRYTLPASLTLRLKNGPLTSLMPTAVYTILTSI